MLFKKMFEGERQQNKQEDWQLLVGCGLGQQTHQMASLLVHALQTTMFDVMSTKALHLLGQKLHDFPSLLHHHCCQSLTSHFLLFQTLQLVAQFHPTPLFYNPPISHSLVVAIFPQLNCEWNGIQSVPVQFLMNELSVHLNIVLRFHWTLMVFPATLLI